MLCHHELGGHSEALHAYRRCRNAKTQALYHSVRERAAYATAGSGLWGPAPSRDGAAMRLFKQGDNHDVRFSEYEREPPLGYHLVTPRRGYPHHGIYVGARKVVHYSGLAHGLRRGPVEEVPFARFACGHHVWMKSDAPSDFGIPEVIC
jgi:hypothetical protein